MQPSLPEPLTEREHDVLRLMGRGMSNRQIADKLVLSVETVRWYNKQIYSKLGVHSRTQATLRAQELRLHRPARKRQSAAELAASLPSYSTRLIGRQRELGEVADLLRSADVRLVTIAGPGGMGKTRLAVEAARTLAGDFPDGVIFVPLATVPEVDEMLPAILRKTRARLRTADNPRAELFSYLDKKRLLLVLDNFEHLLGGAAFIVELLQATEFVKVLVTSITSLNIRREWVRHLDGVDLRAGQEGGANSRHSPAALLFAERARRVQSDFDLEANGACVDRIGRSVQGMPLALEMAAGWLKTLSCSQVADEIQQNMDFLASRRRDADARHHSLRAVFEYAWRLLGDAERRVLQRLSVFRGQFSRKTAEQIAGADLATLSDLVDKSFLYQPSPGNFVFHDVLRRYAERTLQDTPSGALTTRSGMLLTWSLFVQGNFERAGDLADGIVEAAATRRNPVEEAFALAVLSVLAGMEEDYERGRQLCEASRSLSRQAKDRDPITLVFSQLGLAVVACGLGDYGQARRAIAVALNEAGGLESSAFVTLCLPVAAILLAHEAEPERAAELLGLALTHPASTPTWMEKWPMLVQLTEDLEEELGPDTYHALGEQEQHQSAQVATLAPVRDLFRRLGITPANDGYNN